MSMFSRALAGAASGAATIANKYLDEELAQQRAQVLADIALQQHKKLDAYDMSPDRQAMLRENAVASTVAQGGAADTVALNRAGNTALTQATIDQTNATSAGTRESRGADAAIIARAQAREKLYEVEPGKILFDGSGGTVAENKNPTAAQLQLDALREGLKGKKGEDRDRAYESMSKSIGEQLKEKQTAIDKFLSDNPQALTAPKPAKKGILFDDKAEVNPAYDNYQRMLLDRNMLVRQQTEIVNEWRAEKRGGGGAAPAARGDLGLFPAPSGGGSATPSAVGDTANPMKPRPGDTDIAGSWRAQADELRSNVAAAQAAGDAERADRNQRDLQELTVEARKKGIDLSSVPASAGPAAPPAPAAPPQDPALIAQTSDSGAERRAALESMAPESAKIAAAAPARGTAAAALANVEAKSAMGQAKSALKEYGEQVVKDRAEAERIRSQFEVDKATMPAADFTAKYAPFRAVLSIVQNVQLMKIARVH